MNALEKLRGLFPYSLEVPQSTNQPKTERILPAMDMHFAEIPKQLKFVTLMQF